jgi:hypothetical protein
LPIDLKDETVELFSLCFKIVAVNKDPVLKGDIFNCPEWMIILDFDAFDMVYGKE